jgi:ribosomal protein S12 methylthiotransferase
VYAKKKVFLVSLGCAKNLVDSEHILGLLKENGFIVGSSLEEAEIAIINTCGFIQSAVEESIDTILEIASLKSGNKLESVFVAGCFVQRYGYRLQKEIPEVDGWLGTGEIHRIVDLLEEKPNQPPPFFISKPNYLADHTIPRVQTTPFYSAYLKISEGCPHRCSYCTIPSLRGPFRSRNVDSLIVEAGRMVEQGVKEINLVSQDTTLYGSDLKEDIHLEDLIERLARIDGLTWIRLLYCHPLNISDHLLELLEGEEALCPYIDLPIQHINEDILRAMHRPFKGENMRQLLERIKSLARPISLRTTLMVGFPGETDAIFEELYEFVERTEFDHLGVFIFSPEKGTPAARLKGVPERKVAENRLEAIMSLQAGISKERNRRMVGDTIRVLIEGFSSETDLLLKGRTATMAPDVDGQVLISKGHGEVGEIVPVLVTEGHTYDLVGEIV